MASCMQATQPTLTISKPLSDWKKNEKKAREKPMNDIKQHVCALLNSNGGTLILNAQADENTSATDNGLKSEDVIRAAEQIFHPVIGTACVSSHLSIRSETSTEIVLEVKESESLCTLSYNMFLPTDTQVLPIKPDELSTVTNLMNHDRFVDITEFENTRAIDQFVLNSVLSIKESKTVQFKCLKSEKSKYNDLGSRIINNKFTSYVSAFANHIGGRIYVGIDKTGRVVGETITKADHKNLEMKLQKHVDEMLWPEYCSSPVKGRQWDISFHTVTDSDGCPVETKISESEVCVIVITIHACPGGVFVREPESYHIVKVKNEESENSHVVEYRVEKMDFTVWKNRLFCPKGERDIPRTLSTSDWSSHNLRKQCDALDGKLLRLINYGKWKDFERVAKRQEPGEKDPNRTELELVLLSKWYVYHYRKGEEDDFESADRLMEEFEEKSSKSKDSSIFEIRGRLCLSALQRTRGKHKESYKTARDCLSVVEKLSPCILTAEFYVHFATMLTIIEGNETLREELKGDLSQNSFKEDAMIFYNRALEHLQKIRYVPLSKADMEQKSHINMAILKLGCSLSGDVVDHTVKKEAIEAASTCLQRVDHSILKDGNPLSGFRSCHHKFATSSLYYRRSQHERQIDKRMALLESAIQVAEEVEFLATKLRFHELSNYARSHTNVYSEELTQLQAENYED